MCNRLKELMELRGLTQKQMADVLGIDQGSVSLYSSNRRKLPTRHIDVLVDIYGINRYWLIGESNVSPFCIMSNNRLKDLMRLVDLKQEDIADLLGVHQSYISQIVSNKKRLLPKYVDILVEKYNINRDWLLGVEDSRPFALLSEEEEILELFKSLDEDSKKSLFAFARFLKQENEFKDDNVPESLEVGE